MADDRPTYRPFEDLNELVAKRKMKLREQPTPSPAPEEDEPVDFREVMKDVRGLPQHGKRLERKAPVRVPEPSRDREEKRLLTEALRDDSFNVVNMPEYMEGFVEGTDPITMEKLRAGEFSVQKSLDLHGFPVEEANLLFHEFITDAVRLGLKCVKVIHGRGLKSPGQPVLREELKSWIVRAMHRKWVVAFANARMPEGGPGATHILLRSTPSKKRIHIIG
jgi:DNA-nicking Smr family endonuclease